MAKKLVLLGSILACHIGAATAAAPVALVEDAGGATPALQPLDYVSAGQVVALGDKGTLTLGYLASCVHEEITGGRVVVGERQSDVTKGQVKRTTVECDGGRLALAANQSRESGAVAVRSLHANIEPKVTVFDVSPVFKLPRAGKVVIKRLDVTGERHTIEVAESETAAPPNSQAVVLDLASKEIQLIAGGTYMVSAGGASQVFRVAEGSVHGSAPLFSRLVPF